jgi:hypothetical protein
MSTDFELFKGKNLSDLFKDIYVNQLSKKNKISEQIDFVRSLIKDGKDLSHIGNVLTDLINASIKNDDQLVKLAAVVQKIITAERKSDMDNGLLTEEEKQQLLLSVDEILEDTKKIELELQNSDNELAKKIKKSAL